MKTIIIENRISGTTTGRYPDKLIEYIARLNTSYKFIVLTKSKQVDYIKSIAPQFEVIESNFKEFSFSEQVGLMKQLKGLQPDLVHFPMVQQPVLYRGHTVTSMLDTTTLEFRNPSKNIVIFKAKQYVYYWVNWIAAKKSRHIITISDYVKDVLQKKFHIQDDKITTTYCAADFISEKPQEIPSLKNEKFIMYAGRPLPHKNLERLLEAFVMLSKTHPSLKLALVGKKDVLFEEHEKRAATLGLKEKVIFTDFVSEGQLRWLYENCEAYVFPSLSEGFGLPGLEAMQHGAPVVSSNATCLPEVYGNAAYYFDPLDVKDIANKIEEVLVDQKLRSSLIKKGHEQAKKYSWEQMAKQTLKVYEKALG